MAAETKVEMIAEFQGLVDARDIETLASTYRENSWRFQKDYNSMLRAEDLYTLVMDEMDKDEDMSIHTDQV